MSVRLQTVIACVHYDDFLALTLLHNLPLLDAATVLTSPHDAATIALANRLGVPLFLTEAWHTGGPLNKALALNEWLTHASAMAPDAWFMSLDADILLFTPVPECLPQLDPTCLYGPRRRMCDTPQALQDLLHGRRSLQDLPLEPPITVNLKMGEAGAEVAVNPAALSGYFQLWHQAAGEPRLFQPTGTAQTYDVLFGLQWPEQQRVLLDWEVVHLGPTQVNWSGRQSERWA